MAQLAADLVVLLHLLFIIFVVAGALLVPWKPWIAWLHIPAALWGAAVEFAGWICPLTPLEQALRASAGARGYSAGFIEHYLLPVIYPGAPTREIQFALGLAVVAVNALVYWWLLTRRMDNQRRPS